ncbi:hypothetical protein PYCCODRAFT_1470003 [Trametes coccinea BRFM310]|uniref:Uncharacterized protein n=1 Tax=Trametes coccinea (strain BRFM310) TaxID=1353009 RepID=A0A1Y2IES0_TRAC3|nr:hypothetical protein PYCCODRAFT_1470003 [Trametes coccinea BRFM310]
MSSAGPSRPRVITLTADQLLGTSLTPARTPKPSKNTSNGSRVLTIEDLLGPGLTVARPPPKPPARSSPRPTSRSFSSTRSTASSPNPRLVRVTADEVLRTGIPVRTLQAVKARSGQARVLTAEELLSAGSSRSPRRSPVQSGSRASASDQPAGPSAAESTPRAARPGTATASSTSGSDAQRAASQSRNPRHGPPRRSLSLGSMRTLPIYTQEPGESEVVIDRGATELDDDDDTPITVISPVEENEPNVDVDGAAPTDAAPVSTAPSSSESPTQASGNTLSRQLSPVDAATSSVASSLPPPTHMPPWVAVYREAAPSYEMAMSTPNLHVHSETEFPANFSLPTSPTLEHGIHNPPPSTHSDPPAPSYAAESPAASRPTVRVQVQPPSDAPTSSARLSPSPRSPGSPALPSSPATPSSSEHHSGSGSGAETPRRRFGFMALFHSRSSSRLRSHSHSHSHSDVTGGVRGERTHARTGSASAVPSPRRAASPNLLAPVPTRSFVGGLHASAGRSAMDLAAR